MSREIVLVTGSAGFIGYHLAERLLAEGKRVVGVDDLNSYYDVALKKARNALLQKDPNYIFVKSKLENKKRMVGLFDQYRFTSVYHMAAQPGVRHSIDNPDIYVKTNVEGTLNILEAARHAKRMPHLIMASSSSVYGLSERYPLREDDPADRPVSLYGALKRSNELMGHAYAHLFKMRITMVRFFTAYGPWGRPDMAPFLFVRKITDGRSIQLFNHGDMVRDFTYIDDIVDGILGLASARLCSSEPLYDVFNIGSSNPRTLVEFVKAIERSVGKPAKIEYVDFQQGDVHKTCADVNKIKKIGGYCPKVSMEEGIQRFVAWYKEFYA